MHNLQTIREAEGLSIAELAELSGISQNTIRRIEQRSEGVINEDEYHTNEGVACDLADALYRNVEEIFSPDEISRLGRPPHTGRPIVLKLIQSFEHQCRCGIVLPQGVDCEYCQSSSASAA